MDPRVEDFLLLCRADRWYGPAESRHVHWALEKIGLLERGELERWEREQRTRENRQTEEGIAARAAEYLEQALADPPPVDEREHWGPAISSVIGSFERAGVLSRSQTEQFSQKLRDLPIQWPPPPTEPVQLDGVPVAIVPGPPIRRLGVRVLAVELHDEGVATHFQFAKLGRDADGTWPLLADEQDGPSAPEWNDPQPAFALSDDLGTEYSEDHKEAGGGLGDLYGPCEHFVSLTFTPAVPAAAHHVELTVAGLPIRIEIPE